ncbi:hypothetical protein HU200_006421 [Digitaria exilis]|uniref:Uncharacterized protein n=1 Tax=Digitaria exilis TaxID=1010633 RepID=A0A835FRF9_9POAL|nr:hypothetical protein HU200_006421 [Digitaria exilis]
MSLQAIRWIHGLSTRRTSGKVLHGGRCTALLQGIFFRVSQREKAAGNGRDLATPTAQRTDATRRDATRRAPPAHCRRPPHAFPQLALLQQSFTPLRASALGPRRHTGMDAPLRLRPSLLSARPGAARPRGSGRSSFMNIYIVGLNQLFDIEIDKVNKPTLPLASGEYTPTTGVAIVSVFAAMSFGLGWAVGSQPLFWALFISFVLGTAYSINVRAHKLPQPELLKGTVIHVFGLYSCRTSDGRDSLLSMQIYQTFVFRRPAVFTRPLMFATGFMTFFSVVIALFKVNNELYGMQLLESLATVLRGIPPHPSGAMTGDGEAIGLDRCPWAVARPGNNSTGEV